MRKSLTTLLKQDEKSSLKIRKLTAKYNDEQVTSEGMLVCIKRIEVQRAQATILNNITESHQFDKVKVTKKSKGDNVRHAPDMTSQ